MIKTLTKEEHIEIHKHLHQSLCDLLNDFQKVTGHKINNESSIKELFVWSNNQCINPTSAGGFDKIFPSVSEEQEGRVFPTGNGNNLNINNIPIITTGKTPPIRGKMGKTPKPFTLKKITAK